MSEEASRNFDVDPASGLVTPARILLSPNRDARPDDAEIDLLLLHGISLPPGEFGTGAVASLFLNELDFDAHPWFDEIRGLEVSAHLYIDRGGDLTQFVPLTERAWHAGASSFRGRSRCNDFAIGIELEGTDTTPYTDEQYKSLVPLVTAIIRAYPRIDARAIAAHSDVAPRRKSDPGPAFDWQRLYDGLPAAAV